MGNMDRVKKEEIDKINTEIDTKFLKSHFDLFYDSFMSLGKSTRSRLKEAIPKLNNYIIYGDRHKLHQMGAHLLSMYPTKYKWQFIQYEQLKNGMFSKDYDDKERYVDNMHHLVIVYISEGASHVYSTEEYHLAPFIDRRAIDGLITVVLCEKGHRLAFSSGLPRVRSFNLFKHKLTEHIGKGGSKKNNEVSKDTTGGKIVNGTSKVYEDKSN